MIALLATHGESLVAVQQGVASPGATLIGLYQGFRFGTDRRSAVPFRSFGTERNMNGTEVIPEILERNGTERGGTEPLERNGTERPFRSGGTSPFPVPFRSAGTERNGRNLIDFGTGRNGTKRETPERNGTAERRKPCFLSYYKYYKRIGNRSKSTAGNEMWVNFYKIC